MVHHLIIGDKGISALTSNLEMIDGKLKLKLLEAPVENIDLRMKLVSPTWLLRKYTYHWHQGTYMPQGG